MSLEELQAATERKGHHNVRGFRQGEVVFQMRQKGVVKSSRYQRMPLESEVGWVWDIRDVVGLRGDDVAYTAAWVGYVTGHARNEVHVEVKDGLSGGFAVVDADVIARNRMAGLDRGSGDLNRTSQSRLLFGSGFEPGWNVADGYE